MTYSKKQKQLMTIVQNKSDQIEYLRNTLHYGVLQTESTKVLTAAAIGFKHGFMNCSDNEVANLNGFLMVVDILSDRCSKDDFSNALEKIANTDYEKMMANN